MTSLIKFLDGKKTIIGSVLVLVGTVGAPVFGIPVAVAGLIATVGTMLGGAGIVHKAIKSDNEQDSGQE